MLQAYEAYIDMGQIFPINIPFKAMKRHKAIITILEEPVIHKETTADLHATAWEEFFAAIENCDEEVPEFERVKFREADI